LPTAGPDIRRQSTLDVASDSHAVPRRAPSLADELIDEPFKAAFRRSTAADERCAA
jgi:hypothetical protein